MMPYSFDFERPLWLVGLVLLVPVVWMGLRYMEALGRWRRAWAIIFRCLTVIILVLLLAGLTRVKKNEQVVTIVVLDRSLSIPADLENEALEYLAKAVPNRQAGDLLAVIDVAEAASISKLPSSDNEIRQRNPSLSGLQTRLADGIQMAMAIAPPNAAVRILLISEGNQTAGDVKEAARIAGVNGIPIDVLPIRYRYDSEVVFKKLVAPVKARSNETVALRFVLESTAQTTGKLFLKLNGQQIDLDRESDEMAAAVELKPGTNVKSVSIPLGSRGVHQFEAVFVPDEESGDGISENNRATSMTFVSGPGHILVVDADNGVSSEYLIKYLNASGIETRYTSVSELPDNLTVFMDTDAVVLANTECSSFTYLQQEMFCRYVTELGGGLVMTGGPASFGAGGWTGSPVAKILPVDLEPPQKKELPKGALVLIMHSCEMPQGNFWGEMVAIAAVETLSRLDLVGILTYSWQGSGDWAYPLSEVGDKKKVISAIKQMQVGDMPDMGSSLQEAYDKLSASDAAQKHVIIISDGDPQPPTAALLKQLKDAGITVTGVAVFPHNQSDVQSLMRIAQLTGGRFYDVKDPQKLPQIFIKEAQEVKRSLIIEKTFAPQLVYSLSELARGLGSPLPNLDGYVLTGPKGGLSQLIMTSDEGDPILASTQAGLGRTVAFTSSVDSRWAMNWLAWGGTQRLWEQAIRWAGRPAQSTECEVLTDVQGRDVTVNVEAVDSGGNFLQLAGVDAQIIGPDMSVNVLELNQVGPGQFKGNFEAKDPGSYIVNLRYRKTGEETTAAHFIQSAVMVPFAPEFQEMTDNAALLSDISTITGGRVLVSDPNKTNLFEHTGLKFPKTQLPTRQFLMFLWLGVFLADIAVRRVVIDFRAILRRLVSVVFRQRKAIKADQTLERLQLRRKKVKEQLTVSGAADLSGKRYEAAKEYKGEVPAAAADSGPKEPERPAKEEPKAAAGAEEDKTHIGRLLKAKKQAMEREKDNKDLK